MDFLKGSKNYLSMIKFSHTIFAMPFAFIGFFLAWKKIVFVNENSSIQWLKTLLLVVLCMVFARSAAMAFNRYLDADIDKKNMRTKNREVASGIISKHNALLFVIVNSILFIVSAYFINSLCFYLSPIALFVILFYSYTKRFTAWCHLVLGLGLSLAPLGAYLALYNQFSLLPILFSFIVFTWVSGFDILYALQDEEFDKNQNLHSIPAKLGRKNALLVSRLLHVLCAITVLVAGWYGAFDYFYFIGAGCFLALLFYQQSLVKENDISRVNLAFGTLNGIASVLFAIFVLADITYL